MQRTCSSCRILIKLGFSWQIFETCNVSKIRSVGVEFFYVDRRTQIWRSPCSVFAILRTRLDMKCSGQYFKLRQNGEWKMLRKKKLHDDDFWETTVLWEERACPEKRVARIPRNVGTYLPNCTASYKEKCNINNHRHENQKFYMNLSFRPKKCKIY
jgi:hypothetical protein